MLSKQLRERQLGRQGASRPPLLLAADTSSLLLSEQRFPLSAVLPYLDDRCKTVLLGFSRDGRDIIGQYYPHAEPDCSRLLLWPVNLVNGLQIATSSSSFSSSSSFLSSSSSRRSAPPPTLPRLSFPLPAPPGNGVSDDLHHHHEGGGGAAGNDSAELSVTQSADGALLADRWPRTVHRPPRLPPLRRTRLSVDALSVGDRERELRRVELRELLVDSHLRHHLLDRQGPI